MIPAGTVVVGIYKITNMINGKFYIGASNNVRRRLLEHRTKRKTSGCKSISLAIKKYGKENFSFELIDECGLEVLQEREVFWIAETKPKYNRCSGGKGCPGHTVSDATRKILSKKGKAHWDRMTEEERKLRVETQLTGPKEGHVVSEETRNKIRKSRLGSTMPTEVREKIGNANRVSMLGNTSGNKKVDRLSMGGEFLHSYDSIVIAAKELGIHPAGITKAIQGTRQKIAGGFRWRFSQQTKQKQHADI